VPRTQWEAGRALALSYPLILGLIVLPQAMRIAVPPTFGFLVQLIKGTSLAAIIGFVELTRAGQLVTNATFRRCSSTSSSPQSISRCAGRCRWRARRWRSGSASRRHGARRGSETARKV